MARKRIVRGLCLAAFFGALAAGSAPSVADQLVVVASSHPEIRRGTILDGTEDLELPAGRKVTLVSKSGELIELEGPRSGPPAPAPAATANGDAGLLFALERLLERRKTEETPGVFRAGPEAARPEEPWWVDTTRSGHYCTESGRPPLLVRPVAGVAETVAVKRLPDGAWIEARWGDGEAAVTWPADVTLEDGASYFVRKGAAATHRQIVLHLLPAGDDGDLARLVGLVRQGCMPQAETLAERLE